MKYMMLIYANASQMPQFTPEERQAAVRAWAAFTTEAEAAGVLVSNHGLYPVSDATTVRVRNSKTLVTDGPFAETHEQLGGYFILDCNDLDEAIGWAEKMPGAKYGMVEIRPVMTYTQE